MESSGHDGRSCLMSPQTIPQRLYVLIAVSFLAALNSCGESRELEQMFFDPDPDYYDYRVTSPNGGEAWSEQAEHEITWSTSWEASTRIQLYYSMDAGSTWIIVESYVSNDGSFDWTIPDLTQSSDSCLLKVQQYEETDIFDVSNEYFSLVADSTFFQVTSPNGGESWTDQTPHVITWNSGGEVSAVAELYYSMDAGSTWVNVDSYVNNDGGFDWTTPEIFVTNTSCLIRITDYYNESISDISDANFTITSVSDESIIGIISPNGGEIWHEQSIQSISWTVSGEIGGDNVKIQYSLNSGSSWHTVINSTLNDGNYEWLLPDISDLVEYCLIKVSSYNQSNIYDVSDNYFSIPADHNSLQIQTPNGGENLLMGSQHDITWTSSGDVGNIIKLYYSSDGGNGWYTIDNQESNDGSFQWTVPSLPEASSTCLLKIEDYSNSEYLDISDNYFTINPNPGSSNCDDEMPSTHSGSISSPGNDQIVNRGSSVLIDWNYTGATYLSVYLYLENTNIATLSISELNNGLEWLDIPSTLDPAGCYHIVIMSTSDSSDYIVGTYFTIQ
jgi:hypothetical protein